MDLRKIKKLIELLEESQLAEIEISEGDDSIRLSRYGNAPIAAAMPAMPAVPPAMATATSDSDNEPEQDTGPVGQPIESPTVGTFYSRPGPDDAAFVKAGDTVRVGDTLCIVEAMKTFNEIKADISGTVVQCLKDDGDPVEFGETLFLIN